MEIYEIFETTTPQGEHIVRGQWTSEGVIIKDRLITIEELDWCQSAKLTSGNKLEFILLDGTSVFLKYNEDEKEKADRVKKQVRDAIDDLESRKAHEEAKNYREVFKEVSKSGKITINGEWTYEGMRIGKTLIPIEDIDDCKVTTSGYSDCILFDLKNGKSERFELANDEQYEQGKTLCVMVSKMINKFESGEWVKE